MRQPLFLCVCGINFLIKDFCLRRHKLPWAFIHISRNKYLKFIIKKQHDFIFTRNIILLTLKLQCNCQNHQISASKNEYIHNMQKFLHKTLRKIDTQTFKIALHTFNSYYINNIDVIIKLIIFKVLRIFYRIFCLNYLNLMNFMSFYQHQIKKYLILIQIRY